MLPNFEVEVGRVMVFVRSYVVHSYGARRISGIRLRNVPKLVRTVWVNHTTSYLVVRFNSLNYVAVCPVLQYCIAKMHGDLRGFCTCVPSSCCSGRSSNPRSAALQMARP